MTDERTVHNEHREIHIHDQGQYAERDIVNLGESQRQTLAEAATEIQALLQQLESTYAIDTPLGKMQAATDEIAQIESNTSLKSRLFSAGRAAALATIEQTVEHPLVAPVVAALQDWQETKPE